MSLDGAHLRRLAEKGHSLVLTVLSWVVSIARSGLRWVTTRLTALWSGRAGQSLRGPVRTVLVGRRPIASLSLVLLAAIFALATAVGVGMTAGSDRVANAAVETWSGAELHHEIVVAACLLVGVGALSAALNSGFVPTFALVASVPFGIGLARYGTEYTVGNMTLIVSLPEAIADGTGAALVVGLPLAVLGYLVGASVRRVVGKDRGNSGPRIRPERT
ncbi:hypothetical protein [Natrinema sp. SYSU A 869]|uniref:hypothetical protein n=1 Tax=Natrinema sp. SYSU A 869 TaxID=2871694 RepID=UPI00210446EB|nr:hypothetical protein [Natrinema sp. SYSU A 869]